MPETGPKIEEDVATLTDGIGSPPSAAAQETKQKKSGGLFDRARKKGPNIDLSWSAKAAYPTAIFVIVLILCWFMYFLYNNVYQTIAMGQNLTNLKALVITQNLNEADFEKILELAKNKNAGASWRADNINNPFIFAPRIKPAAAAAASTSAAASLSSTTAATTTATTTTKK